MGAASAGATGDHVPVLDTAVRAGKAAASTRAVSEGGGDDFLFLDFYRTIDSSIVIDIDVEINNTYRSAMLVLIELLKALLKSM